MIQIRKSAQELLIVTHTNPRILCGIAFCYLQAAIRAAVIDDYVFPIGIRLSEHTFNAFCNMLLLVIDRGHNADERLLHGALLLCLVHLVCRVCLVCLVTLDYPDRPDNQTDQINQASVESGMGQRSQVPSLGEIYEAIST